ncbi:putative cytochrome P450 monooxygenase [Patellaria atrata CBS 101060]|uniref:Cytochrome P450 monooxygenase n=1 Tax=Patellaria atrata CBS 101060 TaxID=1346257 RepID=A0A9P4SE36_9PEZI|nr:putative cytochrome P450 monooxygenase [Patellaria atrata CBS 101060]
MLNEFFIGATPSASHSQKLDISSFSSLQSLKSNLGKLFAFADVESLHFHSPEIGPLDSLEAIKSTTSPIEIRSTQYASVISPPGPRPLPVVGNHYEIYPDPLGNYDRLFARYGPVIKTTNMGTTIFHTNSPEISRHVLREGELFTKLTSDPSHPLYYMREQTALFTCDSDSPAFQMAHKFVPPAMSPRAMAHHAPLVQDAARSMFNILDELSDKKLAFNVYQYMFKMGGQVIWRVVVGQDLEHFKSLSTPPAVVIRLFGEYLKLMKKTSLRPKWYGSLPFGEPARLREVKRLLWENVEKALNECVVKDGGPLSLQDPAASLKASCIADFLYRARGEKGEGLPPDILLANVVVLLGAGFTTSASLLSWCIYSLVKYPGNQERLLQELIDNGADGKRTWTHDELHSMKFLDCFVKETQRMHSPSFQTARNAKKDVVLPGGYLIPAGSIVIPCFPSIHKNPEHWENPARFDPDRWIPEGTAGKAARKGLYTPFAAGGRGCVGFNLALLEVKMVLAELVYRYHFDDSSTEAVVYDPEFLVVRPLNLYTSPTRRSEWPSPSTSKE